MTTKKVFITGASGFVGSHLVEYLAQNHEVTIYGTVYGNAPDFLTKFIPTEQLHELNLLEAEATKKVLTAIQPDLIFHLAALSSPAASLINPAETVSNNIVAQINLLEAVALLENKPRVLVVGSADEYGTVAQADNPVDEHTPMRPMTPYAVSKIAQDYLGLQYAQSHQLDIVRVRPFNHTGEGQQPLFVVPAFAKQIAEIEAGKQESVVKVGSLSSVRDFTDVKDMVQAYWLALEKGITGEVYNLGSGKGIKIEQILQQLLEMSSTSIAVETDPNRVRRADEPELICNPQKFHDLTGWQAQIPLEETLKRVLHYWRKEVSNR